MCGVSQRLCKRPPVPPVHPEGDSWRCLNENKCRNALVSSFRASQCRMDLIVKWCIKVHCFNQKIVRKKSCCHEYSAKGFVVRHGRLSSACKNCSIEIKNALEMMECTKWNLPFDMVSFYPTDVKSINIRIHLERFPQSRYHHIHERRSFIFL